MDAIFFGLPRATARITVIRASGIDSAVSPFSFASSM